MTEHCPYCGSLLRKNTKYCGSCGKSFSKETKAKKEKKLKFILKPSQRATFQKKILPALLMGSLSWVLGDLFFKTLFLGWELNLVFYVIYLFSLSAIIILFVVIFYVARDGRIRQSIYLFFIFTFSAGMIGIPFHLISDFLSLRVHMFVFTSFEAVIMVGLIALNLQSKYFARGYFYIHVVLYLLFLVMAEIIFIILFNIQNLLFTIPVITANILTISLTIMFYGARMTKIGEKENEPWVFITFKILAIFFVMIIGILVYAIIILMILIVVILLERDVDMPYIGFLDIFAWVPGKRKKKKRKEKFEIEIDKQKRK